MWEYGTNWKPIKELPEEEGYYLVAISDPYLSNGGKPTYKVVRFSGKRFDFRTSAMQILFWSEIHEPDNFKWVNEDSRPR